MSGNPVIAPCPFGCPTEVDEDQRSPHLVMNYVGPSPLTQHAGPYTKSHRVVCAVCRCRGPEFVEHNWTREMADAEAVRLWNSRILDEEARKLEILQKINAKVGGPEPCEYDPDCPSCGGHGWRAVDVRNPDGSRGVDQELCDCAALRSPAPGAAEMRVALESYDYWIDNAVTGSDRDALREASDTLADFVRRALPAPEVPGMWTATKDAMPEKSRGLLAFCQGFEAHSGVTWLRTGFAFMAWHGTGWSEQHMKDARKRLAADSLEVTHWMYLVEPKEAL